METLSKKVDFAVVLTVKNANPNGDPNADNRPRSNYKEGKCYGEMTDVCIKRKIRDRLLELGEKILVQAEQNKVDDCNSVQERYEKMLVDKKLDDSSLVEDKIKAVLNEWIDVRAFGTLLAFKKKDEKKKETKKKKTKNNAEETNNEDLFLAEETNKDDVEEITPDSKNSSSTSVGLRGPVTVTSAYSIEPIKINSTSITRSCNGNASDAGKRSSDTMGCYTRVEHGVYVFYGAMNPLRSKKTLFSDIDCDNILRVLPMLFENDESAARPAGSMEVNNVVVWKHDGCVSSAKLRKTITVDGQGNVAINNGDGYPVPEIIPGF